MYKPPTTLPPQLGKWLASQNPALVAKAEAALRDAEPRTDTLLLARIKKERERNVYLLWGGFMLPQLVVHTVSEFCKIAFHLSALNHIFIGFPVAIPLVIPLLYWYFCRCLRPAFARYAALLLALAHRGDIRVVPFLLQNSLGPVSKRFPHQKDINEALLDLLRVTVPGDMPLSEDPEAKDPAALLRYKLSAITRKRSGTIYFSATATATPLHVQLLLALLPHLAADAHPKSRDVLCHIAEARAQTLDEELIKNSARALLEDDAPKKQSTPTSTRTQTERWNATEDRQSSMPLQRLRRP